MNYKELVLSHNPTAYVNYDSGTAVDLVGVMTSAAYNTSLNPVYDYRAKAHGMRSKRIGSSGGGYYDCLKLSDGTRNSYFYAEAWVYIPPNTTPSIVIWRAGSASSPNTNISSFEIVSGSQFYFQTADGSLNGYGNNTLMTALGTVPVGQWFHVGAMYNNGLKKIYLNGVVIATVNVSSIVLNGTNYDAIYSDMTCYIDEWVLYSGDSASILPTDAQILARATFPKTKTKVWSAPDNFWITSGDEQYWNGTQWVSMQDLPYKVWNGTGWVTL